MQDRILRRPVVEDVTGLSRSTIYQLMSEDKFPRPIKLSKRAVGWHESAITRWLESRAAETA